MFNIAKLLKFAYKTSDLQALGIAIEQRNKQMIDELNSDQEPSVFGIGRHFDNVGILIRNAANKVMDDGQAN